MGQTTEQIERQIEHRRRALHSNLEELEGKVRAATDWRQRVRDNPGTMLAAAFGGGLLAANVLGPRRRRRKLVSPQWSSTGTGKNESYREGQVLGTWENLQGALVGVAAKKFQEALAQVVPGLREHLPRRGSRNGRGSSHDTRRPEARRSDAVQGEGDYEAAREYRRSAEDYVRRADIERAARNAAPRDEREAAELAAAEEAGRRRAAPEDGPGVHSSPVR